MARVIVKEVITEVIQVHIDSCPHGKTLLVGKAFLGGCMVMSGLVGGGVGATTTAVSPTPGVRPQTIVPPALPARNVLCTTRPEVREMFGQYASGVCGPSSWSIRPSITSGKSRACATGSDAAVACDVT